jgi:predicted small secreted protein
MSARVIRVNCKIQKANIMIKKFFAVVSLAAVLCSVTACNTVNGMGKDLERAGEATSNTARDVSRKL